MRHAGSAQEEDCARSLEMALQSLAWSRLREDGSPQSGSDTGLGVRCPPVTPWRAATSPRAVPLPSRSSVTTLGFGRLRITATAPANHKSVLSRSLAPSILRCGRRRYPPRGKVRPGPAARTRAAARFDEAALHQVCRPHSGVSRWPGTWPLRFPGPSSRACGPAR